MSLVEVEDATSFDESGTRLHLKWSAIHGQFSCDEWGKLRNKAKFVLAVEKPKKPVTFFAKDSSFCVSLIFLMLSLHNACLILNNYVLDVPFIQQIHSFLSGIAGSQMLSIATSCNAFLCDVDFVK